VSGSHACGEVENGVDELSGPVAVQDVVGVDAADLGPGNELDDPAYVVVVQAPTRPYVSYRCQSPWSTSTGHRTARSARSCEKSP